MSRGLAHVADGAPPIGTGEIIAFVALLMLGMLIAVLYKYIRKMDLENQRLVEEARRLEEERRQFWLSLYGYGGSQAPATSYEPTPQAPQRRLPFYEDATEAPQQGAPAPSPTPSAVSSPYPIAADGFFRVIPCPICEREKKVKNPLFLIGKDPDGTYILSCGHTDETGRTHILKIRDARREIAPIVEAEAVKEAVAAATTSPPPPAKKEKEKKKREDVQEEE